MAADSEISIADQHDSPATASFYVAPTDEATSFNTIREPLAPAACFRLNAPAFAFDSSFPSPDFQGEVSALAQVVAANPGCRAAIFGHADPAGTDEVNKVISDRRATAIFALVTRQPSLWEELYAQPAAGDRWGTRALQAMLQTVVGRLSDDDGSSLPPGSPYYAGAIDGDYGPATTGAVRHFQTDAGLASDGDAGPQTRKVLFGAYMDALCTLPPPDDAPEGTPGVPFFMQLEAFLGAPSRGELPKMALQGCGAFNPILLLARADMEGTDRATRDAEDAPNRRVMIFFFRDAEALTARRWPCPKVGEEGGACRGAFWRDGEIRRKSTEQRREYVRDANTMACKFYDRFARRSPCEGTLTTASIRLLDERYEPCANTPFALYLANGRRRGGVTNDDGWAYFSVAATVAAVDVEYSTPSMDGHRMTVLLQRKRSEASYLAQIANLGLATGAADEGAQIIAFQTATRRVQVTGVLDEPTRSALDDMLKGAVAPYLEKNDA